MKQSPVFTVKRVTLSGAYWAGRLVGANRKMVSVLCLHSISNASYRYAVSLAMFRAMIEKIERHAHFLSIADALEVLECRKASNRPGVVLTIDDGYADILRILPWTRRHRIPVGLFVLAQPERANRRELGYGGALLGWKELRLLQREGWTIGCHGATHADFAHLTNAQIEREVVKAKALLESRLNRAVDYFAYPKGVYTPQVIQAVKDAGYRAAFTIEAGSVTPKTDRWRVPRTIIDRTHKVSEFPAVYSPTSFTLRKLTDRFHLWDRFLQVRAAEEKARHRGAPNR